MGERPTVVVVGAASRDLDPTDPRGWRLGGTVTYASLAIARLGIRVRTLIGVDPEADSAHELGLLVAAGCEIELANLAHGPVFDNHQTPAGRRQIAHDASDRIPIRELPRTWSSPDAVLLGPVAGELGPAWASAFPDSALIGLGWQGLLRRLIPGRPVERRPVRPVALIARADIALVSAEDLAPTHLPLTKLIKRQGQQLLISNGGGPALFVRRAGTGLSGRTYTPPTVQSALDTTGAGDVLLGVWLAARASARDVSTDRVMRLAMTAAAAKVEAGALAQMPDLRALCGRLLTRPSGPA